MDYLEKFVGGVFTSFGEYIEFKSMRDGITGIDAETYGFPSYLSRLDADEEEKIDDVIHQSIAIKVMKGELSKEYARGAMDAFEARRALIRKYKKKEEKEEKK